jgi:hypothetical protein
VTRVLALDPGTTHTGWVLVDSETGAILGHDKNDNRSLRGVMVNLPGALAPDLVLIEAMSPRGQRLGIETMEALRWSGRLEEAARPTPVIRISRDAVKRTLLGAANVKGADAAIRQVLIDRYGGAGGRQSAVGTRKDPGPLFGITADRWAALGLFCAWQDGAPDVETERAEREARRAAA